MVRPSSCFLLLSHNKNPSSRICNICQVYTHDAPSVVQVGQVYSGLPGTQVSSVSIILCYDLHILLEVMITENLSRGYILHISLRGNSWDHERIPKIQHRKTPEWAIIVVNANPQQSLLMGNGAK